jgi:hypothetical protein
MWSFGSFSMWAANTNVGHGTWPWNHTIYQWPSVTTNIAASSYSITAEGAKIFSVAKLQRNFYAKRTAEKRELAFRLAVPLNNHMTRVDKFFTLWYQPEYSMTTEDWIYVGLLVWVSQVAFGVGLLLGLLWASLL